MRPIAATVLMLLAWAFGCPGPADARTKLAALPERGETVIRLDNPSATLIEEERVLTLQKGLNQVDFSWKGVSIDEDSIRLSMLSHPGTVVLLSVSYPPGENALVWEIHSEEAVEEKVRISYLLAGIDRLIAYKGVADKEEVRLDLRSFLVLRNFSGEDFERARVLLDYGSEVEQSVGHEETRRTLFLNKPGVPVEKVWTFDAAKLPWDPEREGTNVGIPVHYRIRNNAESGLGNFTLWGGKVRVFQEDGHGGTIFLGEDAAGEAPVGEDMEILIGDSRDVVVTQHKMRDRRINVRRDHKNRVVLYDTDEIVKAVVENFKDRPATVKLVQHIEGQWDMEQCNMEYRREDASTLEFEVRLPAREKRELLMHYHRRNVR